MEERQRKTFDGFEIKLKFHYKINAKCADVIL